MSPLKMNILLCVWRNEKRPGNLAYHWIQQPDMDPFRLGVWC